MWCKKEVKNVTETFITCAFVCFSVCAGTHTCVCLYPYMHSSQRTTFRSQCSATVWIFEDRTQELDLEAVVFTH